jgi:hypothetical protein
MTRKAVAIRELTEAIRFTVEYIGTDALPPIPGWSWYDALEKYAPETAAEFVAHHAKVSAARGTR